MYRKKGTYNWNELQENLTPIYVREKNLVQRQQQQNYFHKSGTYIEIVFNFKSKKVLFLFLGLGNRNLLWYYDFLGMWEKFYREKWKNHRISRTMIC